MDRTCAIRPLTWRDCPHHRAKMNFDPLSPSFINKKGTFNPRRSPSSRHLSVTAIGAARTFVSSLAFCQSTRVVHPIAIPGQRRGKELQRLLRESAHIDDSVWVILGHCLLSLCLDQPDFLAPAEERKSCWLKWIRESQALVLSKKYRRLCINWASILEAAPR